MTFASELNRALEVRGVTAYQLDKRGVAANSNLSKYRDGTRLPAIETADILADALDWPALRREITKALTRRCHRCKRQYLADSKNRHWSKYCGKTCRSAVAIAKYRGKDVSQRRVRTARMERAVADFCNSCEPEGFCRSLTCELRKVSPLPFVALSSISRRAA